MKTLKKCVSVFLCLTLSMYGLPVLASIAPTASKVELTEAAMDAAVGGAMHTEILSTGEYDGDTVKALVAVSANCCSGFNYTLESIDAAGTVLNTLASGTIGSNDAKVISGVRQSGDYLFRVTLTFSGVPVFMAQDVAWPQFE